MMKQFWIKAMASVSAMGGYAFMLRLRNLIQMAIGQGVASQLPVSESGELAMLRRIARKGNFRLAIDIGAFEGAYTRALLDVGCEQVHVFEPIQRHFDVLLHNFARIDAVVLNKMAIGPDFGTGSMQSNFDGSSASTLIDVNYHDERLGYRVLKEVVHVTTLNAYLESHDIVQIDLIKLDVEGYEFRILESLGDWLRPEKTRFIQFEFSYFDVYARVFFCDFWNLLSPHYDLYRIGCRQLIPVKYYSSDLEVFHGATNYICTPKGYKWA